ncbi:MAG: hypothetical protein KC877_03265 [Candidatus Kaiserbacteria bacterium]|nr:hypothetical protein [Candidatus Kaiserbacteria bacterium]MCB9816114.1 hypothetical protein [Candidatus Nomurabacteria bacterium]
MKTPAFDTRQVPELQIVEVPIERPQPVPGPVVNREVPIDHELPRPFRGPDSITIDDYLKKQFPTLH